MSNQEQKLSVVLASGRKCGSQFLQSVFGAHEDVQVIAGAEFKPDFDRMTLDVNPRRDAEKRYLVGRRNMKWTPMYPVAECYLNHNPDLKIVGFIRNPIERAFSNFVQTKIDQLAGRRALGKGLNGVYRKRINGIICDINKDIEKRKIENQHYDSISSYRKIFDSNENFYESEYILLGFYYRSYSPFYEVFGDKIQIRPLENFNSSPQSCIDDVFEFCGIEDSVDVSKISWEKTSNRIEAPSSPFWFSFKEELRFIPMSQQSIAHLRDLYRDDVKRMGDLIGYDLCALWGF